MQKPELEQVTKAAKGIAKWAISSPFGRGGLALAIGTGTGSVVLKEVNAQDSNPQPCIQVGFTPDTILNDGVDSTVLEAAVREPCRSGLLRIEAILNNYSFTIEGKSPRDLGDVVVNLQDNGRDGDKIPGDWVFTSGLIRFDTRNTSQGSFEGINGLSMEWPFQFNKLRLYYSDGSMKTFIGQRLLVLDKTITRTGAVKQSDFIQNTPHVINLRDDFSIVAKYTRGLNGGEDLRLLTRSVYNLSPGLDPYDLLTMTTDRIIFLTPDSHPYNNLGGTFKALRRDFVGTGADSYFNTDQSQLFGSQENLRQIILIIEPLWSGGIFHELTHWVAAYLNTVLGLSDGAHWKSNTSIGGILGGGEWIDNGDGTFTIAPFSGRLAKIEQYLLGLRPPEQVLAMRIALDEKQSFAEGARIHGPFKTVTIQDIIAQHGVRTPGPDTALRNFKVGYVYTTSGRLATATEMTARERIAQRLPILWNQYTEGQSTMEFVIPPEPGPAIVEPFTGKTLDGLGATLRFTPNPNIKQFQIQVIPYNNDGPGINLIIGAQEMVQSGRFNVLAPEFSRGNYVMLPGMSYTWRVRTISSTNPNITENDPSWSAWSQDTFRTPAPSAATIEPVTVNGAKMDSLNPTLQWKDNNTQMFYYEVQVSKDSTFNTDPQTATAMVYWELRHGGLTSPLNSYKIPEKFPLEIGATYYWRVRPRVQGDGTPVAWSARGSFKTSQDARVLSQSELEIIREPERQVKNIVSRKQFLEDLNRMKREEQELNKSKDEHWQWVNQKVLEDRNVKEAAILNNNGKVVDWIAYRREEDLVPAA